MGAHLGHESASIIMVVTPMVVQVCPLPCCCAHQNGSTGTLFLFCMTVVTSVLMLLCKGGIYLVELAQIHKNSKPKKMKMALNHTFTGLDMNLFW